MRACLTFALICPLLLGACSSVRELQSNGQHDFQPGPLTVPPDLYGRQTPASEQPPTQPAPAAD